MHDEAMLDLLFRDAVAMIDTGDLAALDRLLASHPRLLQAAMNGKAEALRRKLAFGMAPTTVSTRNQSHGTALHHAVWSGGLDPVSLLVEAGADLSRRDTIYDGTPLGWAKHGELETEDGVRKQPYRARADYLRAKAAT